jgi:hypothetical protein
LKPAVTWIGNSFPGEPLPQYVPLKIEDISVAGDGTAATNGGYNESASAVVTFKDGKYLGHTRLHVVGSKNQSTVAEDPDGKYLFYATDHSDAGVGVGRVLPDGADDPQDPEKSVADAWPARGLSGRMIIGMSVRNGLLFVSHHAVNDRFGLDGVAGGDTFHHDFDGISIIDKTSLKILRSFPLPHAGKLAATHTGDVWAIQSVPAEAGNSVTTRVAKVSGKNGDVLATIEGIDAAALAVDAGDRLLVADRGTDQNIKIFSPEGKPLGAFGEVGGIFAGPVPGAAGQARFDNPRGLGVDADNNLYVLSAGGTWPAQNRIEKYAWHENAWGEMSWQLCGMMFADVATFDPKDETRLYTSSAVFKMDWSKSDGKEWSFAGTTLNSHRYRDDPRRGILAQGFAARTVIGVRYIQARRFLFSGALEAFRFDPQNGLVATPCDYIAVRRPAYDYAAPDWPSHPSSFEGFVWRDRDGDGAFGADEYEPLNALAAGIHGMMSVDEQGNIFWFPREAQYKSTELPVGGQLDAKGNLVYHPSDIISRPMPVGFSEFPCAVLDSSTGDLFAVARPGPGEKLSLIRVAGWRGHPAEARPTWTVANLAGQIRQGVWVPTEEDVGGLAVAGEYVFVASAIHNSVRVYRRQDGAAVGWMRSGLSKDSILDDPHGFQVHRRENGEYVLILGDYLHNKNLMYRWLP